MARKRDVTTHKGLEGETAEELFSKVAWTNKHSEHVALTVYAKLTPEEDAQLAKHNFLRLMGEPAKFPTDEEWEEHGPPIDLITGPIAQGGEDAVDEETKAEESDDEEDAEDEVANALFGGSDDHVLVDDIVDYDDIPFDIDPEDREKDEWSHIIAICDDAYDDAVLRLTQQELASDSPKPAHAQSSGKHSERDVVDVAVNSPKPAHAQRIGKQVRPLQRRVSDMQRQSTKKAKEAKKRKEKQLRKQRGMSDDMSADGRPSGKKVKRPTASSKDTQDMLTWQGVGHNSAGKSLPA